MTPEHWERLVLHPACDLLLLEAPIRCWRSGKWPCTAVRRSGSWMLSAPGAQENAPDTGSTPGP